MHINSVAVLNTSLDYAEKNCNIFCRPKISSSWTFSLSKLSIWHVFRIKNSLRNRGNTRNNVKVVHFSVANTVSCQNSAYFDVTSGNFAKLGSETVHKDSANTRYITIFLRRIQILKIFKVPTEFIYAL